MAGDNEAVQPVKGDVRRYIDGGYKPVGATSGQVLTQGPDWDGINRGIGMFLDIGNNYARRSGGGSGKQDYSGQYQVEMNDIASNPAFHNANGTYNSKGNEAIRALNQKYAPYVSGAEIRATESYVGGGYKESVDSALRESFIKQQAADYEAQNKAALDILDKSHPEYSQLPLQQRIQLGNEQIKRVNSSIALQNTIKNSDDPQVINSAIKSISNNLIQDLSEETIMKIRTTGITTQDRQQLVDLWASIGVQNFGWTPQEAQVNAIKIADGAMGHLREYQKDLIAQTEDEIKFTVNDAKLKMLNSNPTLLAYYAATNGQVPPDVLANLITGNISFGSAYRTVENKDGTYSRQLIVTDKNIRNLGLNYGNEATASASLASAIPEIDEALRAGNGTPLLGLRNLPALGGIMQAKNKDEKFLQAKQQLANDFSIELANNARHYYKGGNEINEDVAKQISDVINTASYLGYTNEECKDIVNNALLSLGMKPVKGAHTPEELDHSIKGAFGRLARGEVLGFKLFGKEQGSQQEEQSNDLGIDVTQYMNENNQFTQAPSNTEQPQVVNDEANQMSRINVYETPEYQEFRSNIVKAVKNKQMTREQGINEDNQFLTRAKAALARVAREFGVKSAKADTVMYYQSPKDISGAMKGNKTIDDSMNEEINRAFNDPKELFIAEFIADKEGYEPKPYKLSGERNKTMAIGHQVITDEDKQIAEQYKDTGIPKDVAANILKKDISERIAAIKNKIGEEAYNRLPKELIAATADASMGFSPNTFAKKFGTLLTLLKEYSNTRDKKLLPEIAKHTHTTTASSSVTHSSRNKARDALVNSLT